MFIYNDTDKVGVFVQINPRPLCDVEWEAICSALIRCGINDIRLSKPRDYSAHGIEEGCLTLFFNVCPKDILFIGGKRFEAGMADPKPFIEVIPLDYPINEHRKIMAEHKTKGNHEKTAKIKLSILPPLSYSELLKDANRHKQAESRKQQKWQKIS